MKADYIEYQLEATDREAVWTELNFRHACAVAEHRAAFGIRLAILPDGTVRSKSLTEELLRRMKREGILRVFVTPEDMKSGSTAASYFFNLFPELEEKSRETNLILVKSE